MNDVSGRGERLEALAKRVEAATGADREIDAEVALLQGLRIVDEGHPLGRCCYDQNGRLVVLPRYTASIDAVRTLIGSEEWDLSTQHCIARATVGIARDYQTSWPGHGEHAGNDPVLALLAAALRALPLAQSSNIAGGGE